MGIGRSPYSRSGRTPVAETQGSFRHSREGHIVIFGKVRLQLQGTWEAGIFEFFAPACEEISGYERAASGDYWAFGARRVETAD